MSSLLKMFIVVRNNVNTQLYLTFCVVLLNAFIKSLGFTKILCSHALRVIDVYSLSEVPERYILKRWRKDAKVSRMSTIPSTSSDKMASLARYKALMRKSIKLNTMVVETSEACAIVDEELNKLMVKL